MAGEETVVPDNLDGPPITQEVAEITGDKPVSQDKPEKTEVKEPDKTDKPETVDWKAEAEKAQKQLKEMQSGLTPKLQQAAKDREENERYKEVIGQLTGQKPAPTDPNQSDPVVELEQEITDIKNDIKQYKDAGFDDNTYEVRNLKRNLKLAETTLNRERDYQISRKSETELRKFYDAHSDLDPKVYGELGKIVQEKAEKGEQISLDTALEIHERRSGIASSAKKAQENAEAKDKADKARTQDGAYVPPESGKDEETEFRNIIAPPDDPIDIINSQ